MARCTKSRKNNSKVRKECKEWSIWTAWKDSLAPEDKAWEALTKVSKVMKSRNQVIKCIQIEAPVDQWVKTTKFKEACFRLDVKLSTVPRIKLNLLVFVNHHQRIITKEGVSKPIRLALTLIIIREISIVVYYWPTSVVLLPSCQSKKVPNVFWENAKR